MEDIRHPDAGKLADLIDSLMDKGSGHVNIFSDGGSQITVDTVNSTEICGVSGACCQPTEYFEEQDSAE